MALLIGTDEAGFGPNLGPLVVAGTVWRVETNKPLETIKPYELLADVVAPTTQAGRVTIADSKNVYANKKRIGRLELPVLAGLAAVGKPVNSWLELVDEVRADVDGHGQQLPWGQLEDRRLPIDTTKEQIDELAHQLRFDKQESVRSLQLIALRARLVYPGEFNDDIERRGNKSNVLSNVTLRLLRDLFVDHAMNSATAQRSIKRRDTATQRNRKQVSQQADATGAHHQGLLFDLERPAAPPSNSNSQDPFLPYEAVHIVCDKHGGRNAYRPFLVDHFPAQWIETLREGAKESTYAWGPLDRRVEINFRSKAESFLPTALASMLAKYLRELAMKDFNKFWCTQIPGLKATAGYPLDARRFHSQIQDLQKQLRIDNHILWRKK